MMVRLCAGHNPAAHSKQCGNARHAHAPQPWKTLPGLVWPGGHKRTDDKKWLLSGALGWAHLFTLTGFVVEQMCASC